MDRARRDGIEGAITDLQRDLYERLDAQPNRSRWTRLWLPSQNERIELVRLWQRTADDLGEVRRLLRSTGSELAEEGAATLEALLTDARDRGPFKTVDAARQFSFELREAIPLLGNGEYLRVLLDEKMQERFEEKFGEGRLKEAKKQLKKLSPAGADDGDRTLGDVISPDATRRIALELRAIERGRANNRRKRHTRTAMRSALLVWMWLILLPLTVSAAVILALAETTTAWSIAVATTMGALGSVLSGFFKLRDELGHLREFRAFSAGVVTQPLVGAVAGLVGFLLVRVGVLALPPPNGHTPSIWTYGVYGFLLGFSEPFLFGVVRRLTGEPSSS